MARKTAQSTNQATEAPAEATDGEGTAQVDPTDPHQTLADSDMAVNPGDPKTQQKLLGKPITEARLQLWFNYHAPNDEQVQRLKNIRQAAGAFAQIIHDNTTRSADQTDAIRKVREAMMTANACVVLGGR